MNFLKKFGQVALKITQIALGAVPLFSGVVPGGAGTITHIVDYLQQVAGAVQQVEIFGQALGLPGTQKLIAATPAVAQIILQSSLMAGRKISDPVKFQAGCQQMAAGMADVLNSLKADGVEGDDKT